MNLDPNLIPLIAIVMGISVVLIPVIGLTARYVLKPFQQALAQALQSRGTDDAVRLLERRMALIEQQLESIETTLERVSAAADFHRELGVPQGRPPAALPATPPNELRP